MDAEEEATEIQGHRNWIGMTSEGEAAVGRIAIWAASVEQNLVRLCAQLLHSGNLHVDHPVPANMRVSDSSKLIKRLVSDSKSTSDEDRADILAILVDARAALEQRNEVLHASVGEIMFGGKSVFFRRRKGTVPDGQSSAWESTWRGIDELDEIGARLFKVSEDLGVYVDLP